MPVRVRSLDVTTDLPRVAAIIALVDAEHVTTQDLAASILRTDGLHLHLAAMTESRHVIGYASWRHFPWDRPDKAAERILVAPSHRGRNIALALKLLSIRAARRYGARRLGTSNDSLNAPMLAINRKLGYRNEPGTLVLSKDVV